MRLIDADRLRYRILSRMGILKPLGWLCSHLLDKVLDEVDNAPTVCQWHNTDEELPVGDYPVLTVFGMDESAKEYTGRCRFKGHHWGILDEKGDEIFSLLLEDVRQWCEIPPREAS